MIIIIQVGKTDVKLIYTHARPIVESKFIFNSKEAVCNQFSKNNTLVYIQGEGGNSVADLEF